MPKIADKLAKIAALQNAAQGEREKLERAARVVNVWRIAFDLGHGCAVELTTRGALGEPRDGARELVRVALVRTDGARHTITAAEYAYIMGEKHHE